jgi:hypothetical protein
MNKGRVDRQYLGTWTSGLMVLRPNATLHARLVAEVALPSAWGSQAWLAPDNPHLRSDGGYRNDQRFLGEFFLARHAAALPARWFDPYRFHANPLSCRGLGAPPPYPALANFTWARDVRLTHFGCVPKPWRARGMKPHGSCLDDVVRQWVATLDAALAAALAAEAAPPALRARWRALQAAGAAYTEGG